MTETKQPIAALEHLTALLELCREYRRTQGHCLGCGSQIATLHDEKCPFWNAARFDRESSESVA